MKSATNGSAHRVQLVALCETHIRASEQFHLRALKILVWGYPVFNLLTQNQVPGLSWLTVPLVGSFSLGNVAQMLWLSAVGVRLVKSASKRSFRDAYVLLMLAFVLFQVINDFRLGIFIYMEYLPLALMNLVIYLSAVQVPSYRWHELKNGVFFSLMFYAGFAIWQVATGHFPYEGRWSSCFANPNFFAMNLLYLLFLAALTTKGKELWVIASAIVVGVVLTKTRTILSVLPLALSSMEANVKRACFVVILLYGMAFLFVSLSPKSIRFDDRYEIQGLNGRMKMWSNILYHGEFEKVFGSGSDAVRRQKLHPMYREGKIVGYYLPQNHYLLIFSETGMIGLFLWTTGVLGYLFYMLNVASYQKVRIALTCVVALLVGQTTENYLFAPLMVHLIMGMGRRGAWEARNFRAALAGCADGITPTPSGIVYGAEFRHG